MITPIIQAAVACVAISDNAAVSFWGSFHVPARNVFNRKKKKKKTAAERHNMQTNAGV